MISRPPQQRGDLLEAEVPSYDSTLKSTLIGKHQGATMKKVDAYYETGGYSIFSMQRINLQKPVYYSGSSYRFLITWTSMQNTVTARCHTT